MTDFIMLVVAIVAVFFILKIAFKVLKFVLILGIIGFLFYYLSTYGFLTGIF